MGNEHYSETKYSLKDFFRIIAEDCNPPPELDQKMKETIAALTADKK
ncbi:MAG: hypothetical protein IJ619_11680 [Eubacterium sp.]|nr:hypothetical protein [Eubacterium sp.]MCR5291646.1 hypothetical protein [Eubacterium sp.]